MNIDIYFTNIEKFNYEKLLRLFKQYGIEPDLYELKFNNNSYMMASKHFKSNIISEEINKEQTELSTNITDKYIRYMSKIIENNNDNFIYKYSCSECDDELYTYIFSLYFAKNHNGFIYNYLKCDYEDITSIENHIANILLKLDNEKRYERKMSNTFDLYIKKYFDKLINDYAFTYNDFTFTKEFNNNLRVEVKFKFGRGAHHNTYFERYKFIIEILVLDNDNNTIYNSILPDTNLSSKKYTYNFSYEEDKELDGIFKKFNKYVIDYILNIMIYFELKSNLKSKRLSINSIFNNLKKFQFKIVGSEACRFNNGLLQIIKLEQKDGKIVVKAGIKVVSGNKYSSSWTYIDLKRFNCNKNWSITSQNFEDINNLIVTFLIPCFSFLNDINIGSSFILKYDKDLVPLALYYIRNNWFDEGIDILNKALDKYKFSIIKKKEIENLIKSFYNNRYILRDKIIENENLFLMKIGYSKKVI